MQITTLLFLGKALENKAKQKALATIHTLIKQQAKTAHLIFEVLESAVPLGALIMGNLIAVRTEETIPIDGLIEYGESRIEESMIPGESIPIPKSSMPRQPGARLTSTDISMSELLRAARQDKSKYRCQKSGNAAQRCDKPEN